MTLSQSVAKYRQSIPCLAIWRLASRVDAGGQVGRDRAKRLWVSLFCGSYVADALGWVCFEDQTDFRRGFAYEGLAMTVRFATICVVFVMLVVSVAGASGHASAESSQGTAHETGTLTDLGAPGILNGTPPSPPPPPEAPFPFSGGVISGQTTYVYNFDYSAEGFTKPTDYTYSDVHWDSANQRIYILADRRDSGDEMLIHTVSTLDTTADFVFTARFRATVQGNWQGVFPVFLAGSSNSQVTDANSIYFFYASRDSNLGWTPYYYMFYKDAGGVLRINALYEGAVNTEYQFFAN